MKSISDLKFWLKAAFFVVPVIYLINFTYAVSTDQSGGTFGDTFGAANAFFSGTALLMLVFAVILQREELQQVKEERNDTRKILEGQELLVDSQRSTLDRQSFEQSFFASISELREVDAKLSSRLNDRTSRSCWSFANDTSFECASKFSADPWFSHELKQKIGIHGKYVFLYVELLFRNFRMIENSSLSGPERTSFAEMLKALIDEQAGSCVLAYVLSSDTPEILDDRISLFKNFALEEHLPEGFEMPEQYFQIAKDLHDRNRW